MLINGHVEDRLFILQLWILDQTEPELYNLKSERNS